MIEPSLAELKLQFQGTPPGFAIKLVELTRSDAPYEAFVQLVEEVLDYSISEMVVEKNILKGLSEDQLTTFLLKPLKDSALNATHDTNNGGHCDIVVKGWRSMRWLGEAKIYTSYGKLWGGFAQLRDRYSSGVKGQTSGAMLIYYGGTNATTMMKNWKKYINDNLPITICADDSNPLEFSSEVAHVGTGMNLSTRHIAIVLRHEATDGDNPPPRRK